MTSAPQLTVLSRREPFVTLHASGLDGPRERQRLVYRDQSLPRWLTAYARYIGPGQVLIAVAMGRTRLGATTRVRSVVTFAPKQGREPFACVYVEEEIGPAITARSGAPLHIIRCAALPQQVRFVELASAFSQAPRQLRPV